MRIREFMTVDVQTAHEKETAGEALERMHRLGIRHLVVIRGREIVGIVSQRDLAGFGGNYPGKPYSVGDLMREGVVTASPEMSVREAANLLRGRVIGCLPVVAGDELLGMITETDVLRWVAGVSSPPPRQTD